MESAFDADKRNQKIAKPFDKKYFELCNKETVYNVLDPE